MGKGRRWEREGDGEGKEMGREGDGKGKEMRKGRRWGNDKGMEVDRDGR